MTRKQIVEYIERFQALLGIGNWRINVLFEKPGKSRFATERFVTLAATHTNIAYKDASIHFDPKRLHLVDEEVILHELLHIVVSGLSQSARETSKKQDSIDYYNEQVVSELARIVLRLIHPNKKRIVAQ